MMRQFLTTVLAFLIPIVIIGAAFEVLVRNIPNDYVYKKEYLDENARNIETLVMGSSESHRGVNPEYFSSKTFNAANSAQSLEYDYKIIEKYKADFENLQTVIIPISYPSLFFNLRASKGSRRIKYYNIYFGMKSSFKLEDYSEVLSTKLKYTVDDIWDYYIEDNSKVYSSTLGWTDADDGKTHDLYETGKKAALLHSANIESQENKDIFEENVSTLNSMVQWCVANKIHVILFSPPVHKAYRSHLNPEQLKRTIETSQEIAHKYDSCIYINMMDDPIYDKEDFYDGNHLSLKGAKKLSLILNKIIQENDLAHGFH